MELDKKTLRKKMIQMRSNIDDITYHRLSRFIIDKLKHSNELIEAKTIGVYLSYHHEVDTWEFIKEMLPIKNICVPVVHDNHQMDFVQIHHLHDLRKNKYGIDEPEKGNVISKDNIDLIIVPLVGYSEDCYRLGYGGGYYDRYLNGYHGKTIGIAFQIQKLDDYIPEKHDIALDKIITE